MSPRLSGVSFIARSSEVLAGLTPKPRIHSVSGVNPSACEAHGQKLKRTIRDLEKPKTGKTGRGTRGANLRLVESLLVLLEPRLRRAQLVLEPCNLPLQLRLAARRRARLAAARAPRLHAARAVVQHLPAAAARAAVREGVSECTVGTRVGAPVGRGGRASRVAAACGAGRCARMGCESRLSRLEKDWTHGYLSDRLFCVWVSAACLEALDLVVRAIQLAVHLVEPRGDVLVLGTQRRDLRRQRAVLARQLAHARVALRRREVLHNLPGRDARVSSRSGAARARADVAPGASHLLQR